MDRAEILEFIVDRLQKTYWARGRSRETILKSLRESFCFVLSLEDRPIGFARVVTDKSTFAYLCDVLVDEEFQGRGFGQRLVGTVIEHPELRTCKWILRTTDAHGLYEKFGFKATWRPERYMEKEPT